MEFLSEQGGDRESGGNHDSPAGGGDAERADEDDIYGAGQYDGEGEVISSDVGVVGEEDEEDDDDDDEEEDGRESTDDEEDDDDFSLHSDSS